MMTKEKYLELNAKVAEIAKKDLNDAYIESKQALMVAQTEEERTTAINNFERDIYARDQYLDSIKQYTDRKKLSEMYDSCVNIINKLEYTFDCEWLDDDQLIVKCNFKRLSQFANYLKNTFGVVETDMFTFDSSFTLHHAATKAGKCIDITTDPTGEWGLIKFLMKPKPLYWLSSKSNEEIRNLVNS